MILFGHKPFYILVGLFYRDIMTGFHDAWLGFQAELYLYATDRT